MLVGSDSKNVHQKMECIHRNSTFFTSLMYGCLSGSFNSLGKEAAVVYLTEVKYASNKS